MGTLDKAIIGDSLFQSIAWGEGAPVYLTKAVKRYGVCVALAIILGGLIWLTWTQPHWNSWLERWQTLIAGTLALLGAWLTVRTIERQIAQQSKTIKQERFRAVRVPFNKIMSEACSFSYNLGALKSSDEEWIEGLFLLPEKPREELNAFFSKKERMGYDGWRRLTVDNLDEHFNQNSNNLLFKVQNYWEQWKINCIQSQMFCIYETPENLDKLFEEMDQYAE